MAEQQLVLVERTADGCEIRIISSWVVNIPAFLLDFNHPRWCRILPTKHFIISTGNGSDNDRHILVGCVLMIANEKTCSIIFVQLDVYEKTTYA